MEARYKAYLAAAAAAALLLALLAATYYRPQAQASIGPEQLPRLFVEAAQGLNESTRILNSTVLGGNETSPQLAARMEEVARLLSEAARSGALGEGALAERLRNASESYSRMALAAARLERLAEEIRGLRGDASAMMDAASRCDIGGAREAASRLRGRLGEARMEAKEALDALSGVDEGALLSAAHRRIYRGAYDAALKAYLMLGELDKVSALLLGGDPGKLEKLCTASRCGGCSPGLEGMGGVAQQLSQLRPGDAWVYGYREGLIKSWLSALTGEGGRSGRSGGQGSGAGGGLPSGED